MKSVLKVTVSLILLGIIIYKLGGVQEVLRVMGSMNYLYVVPILLVSTSDRALMTYKWARLLRGRGFNLPFLAGMKIYCASMVWGTVLPTTVGADAVRAVATCRMGYNADEIVASIIIERMAGFVSALLLGVVGLLLLSFLGIFPPHLPWLWLVAIGLMLLSLGVFAASFSKSAFDLVHERLPAKLRYTRLVKRMRQFHLTYRSYRDNRKGLAVFFMLTFIEQWLPILFVWLITLSLGIRVSFWFMAGILPLTMLLARIPIGIDAIGVYEGVFILMMSLTRISGADSVAIAFLGRILQLLSWMPWWIAHIIPTRSLRPPPDIQEITGASKAG